MRNNRLFKKGLAMVMSGFLALTAVPVSGLVADPIVSVAATKNTVKAKKTVIAPSKANTIAVTKAKKGYKMTVKVLGTGKKFVTVKYGKTVLVKNGTTQKKGKKKVVAKKTKFNLTATATKKALKKNYKVQLVFTKGTKKVTTKPVTVKVAVTKVKLNKTSASLKVGGTVTLKATVNPSNATYKTVSWKTSNSKVATVSKGKVTAKGAGTATITATADGKKATCKVTVTKADVAVTGVTLDKESADLTVGETLKLNATVKPDNATDKTVNWTTTDAKIASVAKDGTVTAVAAGEATITAKAGGKSATCKVTVKEAAVEVESVTLDQSSIDLKVGNSAKLTATVKPDNATDKTVTWKSKDENIAKVVDGTVTGVAEGTTTITATAGSKSAECTVNVTKSGVEVKSVSLDNTAPKVGDQLNAKVDPANADDVQFSWYMGDSSTSITTKISGTTGASIQVTSDMIGKYIQVVAEGVNNSSATAITSVAVREADASEIAIVKAEQIGMNKVKVTFNKGITADDKVTVKKGSTEKAGTFEFDSAEYLTATITMDDNLSSGTYTATLTPSDTKVKATSVEFSAVSATKATRIGFTNNYLVMADTTFKVGYCFVKGYNDFDEEITLSGVTITGGPSDDGGISYDSSTGRVTVKYGATSGSNNSFAVVRNVSLFAQYTGADSQILTANANLEVTQVGYPSKITYGEVAKDGTMRKDGKVTIQELGSNKYYVPLKEIKDQYDNPMDADALNKLNTENLLTVIPTNGSPIYFGTNKNPFTTVDGEVAMFITPGNNMPGNGQLVITSAGGSFTKEVYISDDPYIETLTMDVPDIYEGEETDEFTFSAVDQYGESIDLYDFSPTTDSASKSENPTTNEILVFGDMNHLTTTPTKVTASDNGNWTVKKDTAKKSFTVKFAPAASAKSVVSFTCITAGQKTTNAQVTVGEIGGARQIVSQTSSVQLDPSETTYNIAKKLEFKDANGKTMNRQDCSDRYPRFLANPNGKTTYSGGKEADYADNKNSTDYPYWWTVTEVKLPTDGTVSSINYDSDGVIDTVSGLNAQDSLHVNGDTNRNVTYYVSLLAKLGKGDHINSYVVLDSEPFRFLYAPVNSDSREKYKVRDTSDMLLYAAPESLDTEQIKVDATNDAGETYQVERSRITLAPDAPFSSADTVSGLNNSNSDEVSGKILTKFDDNTSGTLSVKVYVDGEPVDTVSIKYSNVARKAAATKMWLTTVSQINATPIQAAGYTNKQIKDTEYTTGTSGKANISVINGKFVVDNVNAFGDTLKAWIVDQYDVQMTDTNIRANGLTLSNWTPPTKTGEKVNFVISNGSQTIDLDIINGGGGFTKN